MQKTLIQPPCRCGAQHTHTDTHTHLHAYTDRLTDNSLSTPHTHTLLSHTHQIHARVCLQLLSSCLTL